MRDRLPREGKVAEDTEEGVRRDSSASSSAAPLVEAVSKSAQTCDDHVLIRCGVPADAGGMATLAQKIQAEQRIRDLLREADLPEPDLVEYGFTCIRLFFNATKTMVVIDIDQPEDAQAALDGDVP